MTFFSQDIPRAPGSINFLLVQRFGELIRKLWNPKHFKVMKYYYSIIHQAIKIKVDALFPPGSRQSPRDAAGRGPVLPQAVPDHRAGGRGGLPLVAAQRPSPGARRNQEAKLEHHLQDVSVSTRNRNTYGFLLLFMGMFHV